MRRIVIDTNCLLAILPSASPYHKVWTEFLLSKLEICVSNDKHFKVLQSIDFPAVTLLRIQEFINHFNLTGQIATPYSNKLQTKHDIKQIITDCLGTC